MPYLHKKDDDSNETDPRNSFYPSYTREFRAKNKSANVKKQTRRNNEILGSIYYKYILLRYAVFIILPFSSIITLYAYRDVFMRFIGMLK